MRPVVEQATVGSVASASEHGPAIGAEAITSP